MKFLNRIINDAKTNCPFVELNEDEKQFYPGAGWYLIKVKNGLIFDVHTMSGNMMLEEIESGDFTKQGKLLLNWAGEDETYFGMFSCFTFCLPEVFNAEKLAKIARISFENHLEN
tara:strand:- start:134 stop:478 length:345 start_codon:yes stop_codon:yes gene_type:complete